MPDAKKGFWDANSLCKKMGGRLASIRSQKENYLITKKLQQLGSNDRFWIGMFKSKSTRADGTREFAWLDGSKVEFTFWANSEVLPNDKQKCVFLDNKDGNNGRWFDNNCWCNGADCPGYVCKYTRKNIPAKAKVAPPTTTIAPPTITVAPPTTTVAAPTTTIAPPTTTVAPPTTMDTHLIVEDDGCVFTCPDLDCGMSGFKVDENNCTLCECNE